MAQRESFSEEKTAILVAHFDTPSEKAELAPIPKTPAEESSPPLGTPKAADIEKGGKKPSLEWKNRT